MQASELRIGNLVTDGFYDSFKTIINVESIDKDGINHYIEDDGNWPEIARRWIEPEYKFEHLYGIPITEEWLLKLGFEKGDKVYGHDKSRHHIVINEGFVYRVPGVSLRRIQYVHQLQNLYFALAGEELTIKEEK